ncbi:hypothetical protein R5R35_001748 [Gryllus longicercus]|uniref:UBZ1-type domain-containing protein n=1 Tax=Gryllus longicercus TaxID=2509291 RepID=A0AAN9ZF03_9ORTH
MSVVNKKEDLSQTAGEPRVPEISFGSHFALQVALQTMKERCQQLQQRLIAVEGENLSLRVELEKTNVKLTGSDKQEDDGNASDELHQQVAQLQRQKSQLTHHIFMVANENKQLWSRLSRLTQANRSLGSHLSRINDTLSQRSIKCKDSLDGDQDERNGSGHFSKENGQINGNSLDGEDMKEESLEEISLKLIKSFRQEKIELEEQYAQMVEIQEGCPPLELDFAVFEADSPVADSEDDTVLDEVQEIVERLRSLQAALQEQRAQLRSSLSHLETIKNEGRMCPRCRGLGPAVLNGSKTAHAELLDVEMEGAPAWAAPALPSSHDVQRQLQCVAEPPLSELPTPSSFKRGSGPRRLSERAASFHASSNPASTPIEQWMCPLCSKVYPKSVEFEEFQQHVMSHFADEDPEPESIINNFEVVPKNLDAL